MEYLNHVLGIHTVYRKEITESLPNYIYTKYRLQEVKLESEKVIFAYPKSQLEPVNVIKKHLERIKKTVGAEVVLVPDYLTYRQKEYLLRDHIPFIVDGKQIYLPFMAIYLQERGNGEKSATTVILPSAQLLLLHYIYQGGGELLTSVAAKELSFTATSISRASRQLEEMGLIQTERRGVQKVIFSDKSPREIFEAAKSYLINPVKRIIYVSKSEVKERLPISGYSALSEYSMINPPAVECLASVSISAWAKKSSSKLQNSDTQYAVELWSYDPRKLTDGKYVDRLSLALALREDKDERIEEAVEEMLDDVWRDINGKGN